MLLNIQLGCCIFHHIRDLVSRHILDGMQLVINWILLS